MTDAATRDGAHRAAFRGTLTTLMMRLLSFACTQWTLRSMSAHVLGQTSIQLELLLSTLLFLGREGFRLSLTRRSSGNNDDANNDAAVWNVAWLSVPVSVALALVGGLWHWRRSQEEQTLDYQVAGMLVCVASCIEGAAEPAVLYSLRNLQAGRKATAEGLATVAKTVATVFLWHRLKSSKWPVTAFGMAHIVYAVVYFLLLYSQVWRLLPRFSWKTSGYMFDRYTCYMTLIFTLQGLFKHALTEGDRLVLAIAMGGDSYRQGIYALGSAYGGMAARLLLQPLEESARLLWSRIATLSATKQEIQRLQQSYVVFVKAILYLGLLFACVAVHYTTILLNLLAGRTWGSNAAAVQTLSAFCIYTLFLSVNGMTEAFVYAATTTGSELGRLSMAHSTIGVAFAVMAPLAVQRSGTVGLVAANCLAMLARTIYSLSYAVQYFATRYDLSTKQMAFSLLPEMTPQPAVLVAYCASFAVTRWSQRSFLAAAEESNAVALSQPWCILAIQHISVGILSVMGVAVVAFASEGNFRRSARALWKGDKTD